MYCHDLAARQLWWRPELLSQLQRKQRLVLYRQPRRLVGVDQRRLLRVVHPVVRQLVHVWRRQRGDRLRVVQPGVYRIQRRIRLAQRVRPVLAQQVYQDFVAEYE